MFQYLGSFNFLIRASFVCISDGKLLYKKCLFFSRSGFPVIISHDVPLRARGFLMRGKGNVLRKCCFVTVQFLGILIIMMFSLYT